jgi:hypothetical protein
LLHQVGNLFKLNIKLRCHKVNNDTNTANTITCGNADSNSNSNNNNNSVELMPFLKINSS